MISKSSDDFIIAALIGSAIGVAAALMLAPTSGQSLRKKIVNGLGSLPGTHRTHKKGSQSTTRAGRTADRAATVAAKVKRAAPKKPVVHATAHPKAASRSRKRR